MRIVLKNFRYHKHLELTLPKTGLVLLSGKSGSGKTTILTAIEFALYGKARQPYHFGTKTCSVLIDFGNWSIYRSKSPNRLVVKKEKDIYEDAGAEAVIVSTFGLNIDEFGVSSYIKQKSEASLLYMTPSKQMEFMEKVAFQDAKISAQELKQRCTDSFNELKEKSIEYKTKVQYAQQRLDELESFQKENNMEDVHFDQEEYELYKQKLASERQRIENLFKQKSLAEKASHISSTVDDLKHKLAKKRATIDQKLQNLEKPWLVQSRDEAQKEIESCKSQKKKLITQQSNMTRIEALTESLEQKSSEYKAQMTSLKRKLDTYTDRTDDIKRLKVTIQQAKKSNELYDIKQKIIDELTENECDCDVPILHQIKQIQTRISRYEKKKVRYEELYTKYQLQQTILECPECQASLCLIDNNLQSVDDHGHEPAKDPSATIERLTEKLKQMNKRLSVLQKWSSYSDLIVSDIEFTDENDLESKLVQYESEQSTRVKFQEQLDTIKKSFEKEKQKIELELEQRQSDLSPSISNLTVHDLDQKIEQLYDYINTNINLETERDRLVRDRECSDIVEELQKAQVSLKSLGDPSPLKDIERDLEGSLSTRATLEEKVSEMESLKEKALMYQKYRDHQHEIKKLQKDVKEYEKKYQKILGKQEAFATLKEKIKNAESVALEQATDAINEYASYFLKMMFVDDPVTVTLQTAKITKTTQKVKSEINTIIQFRGHQYDSIDQISGGEQDRISLAFVLALNKLFNSPLLMLDECIASLDTALNTEIIGHLHDYAKDRLVLMVAHEANPSFFDTVITVG